MKEQQDDFFSKLGIDISNDKINIDMNQTKDFFNMLKETFENTAENLQKDISEGNLDMSEKVGIKIDKEHINIDLKKTKSFMEDFAKKIEGFLAEIDKSVENIGKSFSDKK